MEQMRSRCGLAIAFTSTHRLNCKPPPVHEALDPSAADNPPNSIHPAAFQTPDTFVVLPPRSKRPCAPSLSNCALPFAQSPSQSPHSRNSIFQGLPAAFLQALDRPPS